MIQIRYLTIRDLNSEQRLIKPEPVNQPRKHVMPRFSIQTPPSLALCKSKLQKITGGPGAPHSPVVHYYS